MQRREKVDLYYGTRKSGKFIRCYEKPKVDAFRVELELHSGFLRHHSISVLEDLALLPELLCPKHLQFVDLDWVDLGQHLQRKMGIKSGVVIGGARRRTDSISRLQRYLRKRGVFNTHRFLKPRSVNKDVRRALNKWIGTFNSE